ncbi:MAG: hypothetical protein ABFS86_05280 [Planctomycetota bacterium]
MRTRWIWALIFVTAVAGATIAGSAKKYQAELERPIELGVSGGNADSDYCFAGTLGCLVEDSSGTYYILSNNHVFSRDINDAVTGDLGDRVTQPATLDNGCTRDWSDVVARVSDWKAIDFSVGGTNVIDAAIAKIVVGTVDTDGTILGIGSPSATPATASVGLAVKKAGRTTGKTKGTVEFTGVTITVDYGSGRLATFTDQIAVGGGFSRAGDSGSLILTSDGDPLALLFAGSSTHTFANPIQAVLTEFGVTVVGKDTAGDNGKGGGKDKDNPGQGKKPNAADVKEKNSKALLAISGVRGHGLGKRGGKDVIAVFVDRDDAALRSKLPKSLDGIDVEVVVTGNVTAY